MEKWRTGKNKRFVKISITKSEKCKPSTTTFIKTDPLQHYKVLMQCQARATDSRMLAVDFYQRVNYVFINIIKVDKRKRDIFFDK